MSSRASPRPAVARSTPCLPPEPRSTTHASHRTGEMGPAQQASVLAVLLSLAAVGLASAEGLQISALPLEVRDYDVVGPGSAMEKLLQGGGGVASRAADADIWLLESHTTKLAAAVEVRKLLPAADLQQLTY